ncbi:MAG: tetratricopeptide repeat protein [Nitrospinae bacterium]|nr:tetratricopeptide repeat protein [Nitrospinota bacterium]
MFENDSAKRIVYFAAALAVLALFARDTLDRSLRPTPEGVAERGPSGDAASSHGHERDHDDPEKNRRMGYFHYNEGNKAFKKGEWKEAVRNYKMALTHDPEIRQVYVNLSSVYLKMKLYDESLAVLRTLEGKDPSDPHLFYNYACYFSLTGDAERGLSSLKKAVGLGHKNFADVERDPDLENLRNTPAYREWIKDVSRGTGRG